MLKLAMQFAGVWLVKFPVHIPSHYHHPTTKIQKYKLNTLSIRWKK